jgi:hypothetical protein
MKNENILFFFHLELVSTREIVLQSVEVGLADLFLCIDGRARSISENRLVLYA